MAVVVRLWRNPDPAVKLGWNESMKEKVGDDGQNDDQQKKLPH